MKISLLVTGTVGEVAPFIPLALGLKNAGHEVVLATRGMFEAEIRKHDIPFYKINQNTDRTLSPEEWKDLKSQNVAAIRKMSKEVFRPSFRERLEDAWEVVQGQGSDAVIYSSLFYPAYHVAEKLNIPAIVTSPAPFLSPTTDFPYMFITAENLGGFLNRLTYELYRLETSRDYDLVRRWCRNMLKMKPRSRFMNYLFRKNRPVPVLYYYSRHLVPTPSNWNRDTLVSGRWFLDQTHDWQPPPSMETFLAEGEPPVYIGFGSTVGTNPKWLSNIVMAALRKTGERAIICSGWGGLVQSDLPESVYYYGDPLPHDWLFPRVKALVHHGGAGTIWTGLRHGKPTLICPIGADQYFWGKALCRLGVGPLPVPQWPERKMSAEKLAAAIKTMVTDKAMQQRAKAVGNALRREQEADPVKKAVKFINFQIDKWKQRLQ